MAHRGSLEFAVENTLEAFRATLEHGGDANEIDIRRTADGVLFLFHDDMADKFLQRVYGDPGDHNWAELRSLPFREPGPFGAHTRIPTLVEGLDLHRRYAALVDLDLKRPLTGEVAAILDVTQMWLHVVQFTGDGTPLGQDPRFVPIPGLRWFDLPIERGEINPDLLAQAAASPKQGLWVEDPRGIAWALGRRCWRESTEPVAPRPVSLAPYPIPPLPQLLDVLRTSADFDQMGIVARARAADQIADLWQRSPQDRQAILNSEAFALLEDRARNRSLHGHWLWHGLDGEKAMRTLLLLGAPGSVQLAEDLTWRPGPSGSRGEFPSDWRIKSEVWGALAHLVPGTPLAAAAAQMCRRYLALSEEAATAIGFGFGGAGAVMFEHAALALITVSPDEATAVELIEDRLRHPTISQVRLSVRGRALFELLKRAKQGHPWALSALGHPKASFALRYLDPPQCF